MLKSGNVIRLTDVEKRELTTLTGTSPVNLNTVEALNNFVDFHVGMYAGSTPEERLLKHLLESSKVSS